MFRILQNPSDFLSSPLEVSQGMTVFFIGGMARSHDAGASPVGAGYNRRQEISIKCRVIIMEQGLKLV